MRVVCSDVVFEGQCVCVCVFVCVIRVCMFLWCNMCVRER